MLVLSQYHTALGDLVHRFEGTLERFAGDGLMVFFNDPLPCPDAPARAVRMAVAMRGRVAQLAEDVERVGATTWASASALRKATPRLGESASRADSTTRRSGASPTWPLGSAGRRSRGRSWSASGLRGRRGHRHRAIRSASWRCEGSCSRSRAYERHWARRGPGSVMTDARRAHAAPERPERGRAQRAIRPTPGAARRRSGAVCGSTSGASQSSSSRRWRPTGVADGAA